jgi:hypothetical protein
MKQRLRASYDAVDTVRPGGSPDYGDPQLKIQEFEIMIDEALGPDYEPDKRRELIALEESFRGRQQALIHDPRVRTPSSSGLFDAYERLDGRCGAPL